MQIIIRDLFRCTSIYIEIKFCNISATNPVFFLFVFSVKDRGEKEGDGKPRSRAGPRRFVKSAKSWVEGSFYRDRTNHPSPKVTCTVEGSLPCLEVMGGLEARFA